MSYPYAKKMGSLREFLQKIPTIAIPEKILLKTLYALGYKSVNDRPIIKVLKFIHFLNKDGTPTENYVNFRSKGKSGAVMAKCLKSAYEDLFGLYDDACSRTTEELRDFFSTRVKGGDLVLGLTANTFKTLCEFADFGAPAKPKEGDKKKIDVAKGRVTPQMPQGITMNLNIQITLPVTDDAKVYENIFKALKEQLFA